MQMRLVRPIRTILGLVTLVVLVAGTTQTHAGVPMPAPRTFSDVPLPAPTSAALPPSPAVSPEAQQALAYIAQREGIPIEQLTVANEFRRDAQLLGREFQAVTILAQQSGRMFKVLVDRTNGHVEERAAIEDAQQQAHQAKYGKLQPALYQRLQAIQATDLVTVTIWMADEPGQSQSGREAAARAALGAKYPEVRAAIESGGKPMDVRDPVLSEQISKEYTALVQAGVSQRAQALADVLKAQGVIVTVAAQLPALTATLPKQLVQMIAQRDDVGTIFLTSDRPPRPTLDTAVKTNRAPAVWARGHDGTTNGVFHPSIAIVDLSNVDFDDTNPGAQCPSGTHNCFRYPGATHAGLDTTSEHATWIASAAASNHSTDRGMAPGALIHSAGLSWPGLFDQHVDALVWALGQDSSVVNASLGECNGREMQGIDWAYEFYARTYFRLFVVAAGNNDTCPSDPDDVTSPGLAWDVLTVGAYDDKDNADWSDDTMWAGSNWQNPFSLNGDREKPEVVAPGVNISMIGVNGQISTRPGTSLAAPQVAGEAALLMDRNYALKSWPEASRAIIMATATNNIEGPTGIQPNQDLKDGAGGINADLADVVAQSGRYSSGTTCSGPCWWGTTIVRGSFDASGYRYYYFTADAGDRVRVATAWWAYSGCPFGSGGCNQGLYTDLDLSIQDPSGVTLPGGISASWDNNYEMVPQNGELVLPQNGTYRIAVHKNRLDDPLPNSNPINYLGVAWTKLPSYGPTVTSWGTNRMDVFVRGGDNQIWQLVWNGSSWSAWYPQGGGATADPDAVARTTSLVDLFVRGGNNQIYRKYWNGSAWIDWAQLPTLAGGATSGPTVTAWGANRMDVFVRGADNAIWQDVWNGSTWTSWYALAGGATSDPDAVAWGTNRVDIVVRGAGNQIYWKYWNGSSWNGWLALPTLSGGAIGGPTITSWGANRLDVFVRGADNQIYQCVGNGTSWSAWYPQGGSATADPYAVARGTNLVDIFVQSVDNTLWRKYWNGSAWVGWQVIKEYP